MAKTRFKHNEAAPLRFDQKLVLHQRMLSLTLFDMHDVARRNSKAR